MPKRKVLKNRNDYEQEKPQQHVEEEQQQQQSTSTKELQLQQQPPRKMTLTVIKKGGQPREYHYRTTVKSFEELDKFRFENYCRFTDKRIIHTFMTITIPCITRKMAGRDCDFELRGYRSSDGGIDVYAYSQHDNHPFQSDVKRLLSRVETELVPDGNPPSIFRTLDNEWDFRQTLPDYDTLEKFASENQCTFTPSYEHRSRIRYYCTGRRFGNCKFMLLAMKTTKKRYHVYKNGEHNHLMHKLKKIQKKARGKHKSRQEQMQDYADEEGEVPMEEEQEDEPEDIAQTQQDEQMETEDRQYPLEKCQRRLKKNLSKDNKERTKKWMGRIDRADIGQVITEMDVENVANLMRIADIDICKCEARIDFWLPWIKKAIRKKASQKREAELVKFIKKFKHLRKIESMPDKLKGKIQKMLDQRRLEMEAQKMAPEEMSSDDEN